MGSELWGKTLGVVGTSLAIHTRGPGFTEITEGISDWLSGIGAQDGLLTVNVPGKGPMKQRADTSTCSVQARHAPGRPTCPTPACTGGTAARR